MSSQKLYIDDILEKDPQDQQDQLQDQFTSLLNGTPKDDELNLCYIVQ